jgi:hypothetical protein
MAAFRFGRLPMRAIVEARWIVLVCWLAARVERTVGLFWSAVAGCRRRNCGTATPGSGVYLVLAGGGIGLIGTGMTIGK